MKLIRMSFHDHDAKWGFKNLVFEPHVTLVVGATGVGKSRLLEAIEYPKQVLKGRSLVGDHVEFELEFEVEKKSYVWKFDTKRLEAENLESLQHTDEEFLGENQMICSREGSLMFLNKEKSAFTPSSNISILAAMQHDAVENLYRLKNSNTSVIELLIFFKSASLDRANEIEQSFCDIFPAVRDIKLTQSNNLELLFTDSKTGVEFGIDRLSTGMRKSLELLIRINILTPETVLLIDEIEAGLGANCLRAIVGEIQDDRDKQYVITSHHHYVLNHFPLSSLRVMAREGEEVRFYTSDDLKLGKSRHEAYTLLLNNDTFLEGKFRDEPVLSG
jgi:AAA15 family ATPase/GTPase